MQTVNLTPANATDDHWHVSDKKKMVMTDNKHGPSNPTKLDIERRGFTFHFILKLGSKSRDVTVIHCVKKHIIHNIKDESSESKSVHSILTNRFEAAEK